MAPEERTPTKLAGLIALAYRLGNYDEAIELEKELSSLQAPIL